MTELPYLTPLDGAALQKHGITGFTYGCADRVRFHELDSLNHVNNAIHVRWFETIRVQYLLDYNFTEYSATEADPFLVVRAQSVDYLLPMFQNESYIVAARTSLLKPTSFVMEYAVFVEGQTRATGSAVVISLEHDGKTRRAHKAEAVETVIARDAPRTENL
ncbi:MAG: acyl-CoA thioesterase [Pseudomonadota bacterium]